MDKKILIRSVLIVIVALFLIGGATFILSKKENNASFPAIQQVPTIAKNLPSTIEKKYVDSSGFTFTYPDDVMVNKKEINDQITYADINLTSSKAAGNISFLVADTKVKSLEQYLLGNGASISATVKEVTLNNFPAREITQNGAVTTVALDQGILFKITMQPGNHMQYWEKIYKTIISSFSFAAPQTSSEAVPDYSGDDAVLEEETIE